MPPHDYSQYRTVLKHMEEMLLRQRAPLSVVRRVSEAHFAADWLEQQETKRGR